MLIHLLKSSFLLFVFWGIYQLLLRKSKFFQVNRYYLLLSSVLAMVVPFFEIELSYSEPLLPSIYQFREVVVTNAFNVSNDGANYKFSVDFYVYLLFCTIYIGLSTGRDRTAARLSNDMLLMSMQFLNNWELFECMHVCRRWFALVCCCYAVVILNHCRESV